AVGAGGPPGPVAPGSTLSVPANARRCRFELPLEGQTAFLAYERTSDALTLIHTEVPPPLRGRHLGEALVEAALRAARSAGLRVVMVCPFARAYQRRHPS